MLRTAATLYKSPQDFEKMQEEGSKNIVQLAASIVSAYVSNNSLPMAELPSLISSVHSVMSKLDGNSPHPPAAEPQRPAVPIKKSISDDFIICLEDGRKFKSLKRHLRTRYNMTPEQYRAKWQSAGGLSDGRPRLRRDAFAHGQGHGSRPATARQGQEIVGVLSARPRRRESAAAGGRPFANSPGRAAARRAQRRPIS